MHPLLPPPDQPAQADLKVWLRAAFDCVLLLAALLVAANFAELMG